MSSSFIIYSDPLDSVGEFPTNAAISVVEVPEISSDRVAATKNRYMARILVTKSLAKRGLNLFKGDLYSLENLDELLSSVQSKESMLVSVDTSIHHHETVLTIIGRMPMFENCLKQVTAELLSAEGSCVFILKRTVQSSEIRLLGSQEMAVHYSDATDLVNYYRELENSESAAVLYSPSRQDCANTRLCTAHNEPSTPGDTLRELTNCISIFPRPPKRSDIMKVQLTAESFGERRYMLQADQKRSLLNARGMLMKQIRRTMTLKAPTAIISLKRAGSLTMSSLYLEIWGKISEVKIVEDIVNQALHKRLCNSLEEYSV